MLFLVYFITAFVAVISDDLVGVSYYFEDNYIEVFSDRQCVKTTEWSLVSYGYLELVPPYEGRHKGIRSLRNSCSSSFPIVFLNGTLEVTVYLRVISQNSGITISVFNELNEVTTSVRYQRSNKSFVPGWVVVTVPVREHTTGYVQLSGQSLPSELVIVDSLLYIPGNSTYTESDKKDLTIESDLLKNTPHTFQQDSIILDELIAFDKNEIEDDDIQGSGENETDPTVTEDPDEQTEDPSSEEDPDDGVEGSGESETDPAVTEDPEEQTEDPSSEEDPDNQTEEPSPEEDRENLEDDDNGFWNVFTITFVSLGAFTVVGLVGVGAYYMGIRKGVRQIPPLDLESLEAPSIIPRARSVFSEATYDARRYS